MYLTYSPRNSRAVSADSTPEAVAALDAYFRENLDVVFLKPLQDSLMPGRYFYGTDNHLSTNGVTMHGTGHRCTDKTTARGGNCAMILVCALAALTTVLALAAHRRAWAAALGMVSGAAVVLAALVLDVSTRTMLLCLLIPCAAAMWPIGGRL